MPKATAHIENVNDRFTTKEKIYYTLAGVVILGGAFFVGRSLIRKGISTAEERKTYDDGSPATYAKRIKMSFENDGWWGTDVEALRKTIKAIPSKAVLDEVVKSYQKLYNSSMGADMQSELKTSEYNEMLSIIATKPAKGNTLIAPQLTAIQFLAWAKRLKAAFDKNYGPFPGTDEDAIKEVFIEIPSQMAFKQVALVYKQEFGRDLQNDLSHELEFWEYGGMMDIINQKIKA